MKSPAIILIAIILNLGALSAQSLEDYYGNYRGEQIYSEVNGDMERTMKWLIMIMPYEGDNYLFGIYGAKFKVKVELKDGVLHFDNSKEVLTPKLKGTARLEGDELHLDYTTIVRYSRDESDTRTFSSKGEYRKR